jgi:serine/threonine protein kinase
MERSDIPPFPGDALTTGGVPAVAGDPLATGETVGRYRVLERVGAGAMGVVYKATDLQLGREVALKLLGSLAPGTNDCSMMCSLLLNEAQVMARLSHPNLVTVFDVGEHRGCVFLAMEYVQGTTLRTWASSPGRGWRERIGALLDAGAGLAEAHRFAVIHRDFKPDNVLVSERGRVLVGDFGVARSDAEWQTATTATPRCCGSRRDAPRALTAATARVGTLAYMAPELDEGGPADPRTDQFAFAVSAWELTFDAQPFPVGAPEERREAVAGGPPPVDEPEDARTSVSAILARALSLDPAQRYPAMADLLAALGDV